MAEIKIQVSGIDELAKKIQKISVNSQTGIQKQVRKSANAIRNAAKQHAPVQSGALKKSIRTKYSKDKLSAEIGPQGKKAWYAHFVEFGTVKTQAKPFMTPAWEQERGKYEQGMKKALKTAVDDA